MWHVGRPQEVNDGYSHAIARARALVDEIQALLARAPPRSAPHVNEQGRMRWDQGQELADREGWTMHMKRAAAGAYDHAHICPQLLAFTAVGSRE